MSMSAEAAVFLPHRQAREFCRVLADGGARDISPMSVLAERIQQRLKETGLSARGASVAAGLNADAIRNIFRAKGEVSPRGKTLQAIAAALSCDVRWLLGETDDRGEAPPRAPGYIHLPIRFIVAAGAWREVDDTIQAPPATFPVEPIPGYEHQEQWLEKVDGDSLDKIVPPGALVRVVDGFGYEPRNGDVVVVVRTRAGGHLQERTLKQVEHTPHGLQLWPRSHNPRWQSPIVLNGGAEDDEDLTVAIAGKVIRAYVDLG